MEIITNGSKWNGQEPDSIEMLLSVLKQYTLDPVYETPGKYDCEDGGPFCYRWGFNDYEVSGNFIDISHAFQIRGELSEIRPIAEAIGENIKTPKYLRLKFAGK